MASSEATEYFATCFHTGDGFLDPESSTLVPLLTPEDVAVVPAVPHYSC